MCQFFQVLKKWSDGLDSWVLTSEDINYMKKSMEKWKTKIFPTVQNKWVSLHQSFGLVCWCDDEQLKKEFMNMKNVHFLRFGQLSVEEKQMLQDKVSVLLRRLGIPSLSEVFTFALPHTHTRTKLEVAISTHLLINRLICVFYLTRF